jgi:predicted TIM-barrel fold metal-dependent hydrolase
MLARGSASVKRAASILTCSSGRETIPVVLIVDAQVHIWGSGTPLPPHRPVSVFSKDELLAEMDAAGVQAALIHPPGWDPGSDRLALEAAREHPDRLAVLGKVPLDRPESRALIEGWTRQPGMLGLRFVFLQPHQKSWPTDGTIDWLWPAAERAGVPVALLAADFLPLVGQVAERHPGLKLIIDHLGRPHRTKDEAAWANLSELLALAKHPNVAVKATGAPSYSSEPYPYRNIHSHLRRLHEAFGPEHLFWGTDITRMPCTWRQCVTLFTEELPWLTARDKELIMGRALCTWLDWKL